MRKQLKNKVRVVLVLEAPFMGKYDAQENIRYNWREERSKKSGRKVGRQGIVF